MCGRSSYARGLTSRKFSSLGNRLHRNRFAAWHVDKTRIHVCTDANVCIVLIRRALLVWPWIFHGASPRLGTKRIKCGIAQGGMRIYWHDRSNIDIFFSPSSTCPVILMYLGPHFHVPRCSVSCLRSQHNGHWLFLRLHKWISALILLLHHPAPLYQIHRFPERSSTAKIWSSTKYFRDKVWS